jgi:hypothetical protein
VWAVNKDPYTEAENIIVPYNDGLGEIDGKIKVMKPVSISDEVRKLYPVKYRNVTESARDSREYYYYFAQYANNAFELLKNYTYIKADKRIEKYNSLYGMARYQLMRDLRGHNQYTTLLSNLSDIELEELRAKGLVRIIDKFESDRIKQYVEVLMIDGQTDFEEYKDRLYDDYIQIDYTFVDRTVAELNKMINESQKKLDAYESQPNANTNVIYRWEQSIKALQANLTFIQSILLENGDISKIDPDRYNKVLAVAQMTGDQNYCYKIYLPPEQKARCIQQAKQDIESIKGNSNLDKMIFFEDSTFFADVTLDVIPNPEYIYERFRSDWIKGVPNVYPDSYDYLAAASSMNNLFTAPLNMEYLKAGEKFKAKYSVKISPPIGDLTSPEKEFDVGIQCENPGFTHIPYHIFDPNLDIMFGLYWNEEIEKVAIANVLGNRKGYKTTLPYGRGLGESEYLISYAPSYGFTYFEPDTTLLIPEQVFCDKEMKGREDEYGFCIPLLAKLKKRYKLNEIYKYYKIHSEKISELWTNPYNDIFLASAAGENGNEVHCAIYQNDEGVYEPIIYYYSKDLRGILDDGLDFIKDGYDLNDPMNPLKDLEIEGIPDITVVTISNISKESLLNMSSPIARHVLKDYWMDFEVENTVGFVQNE